MIANNQIEDLKKQYTDNIINQLSCICNNSKRGKQSTLNQKEILKMKAFKNAFFSNCLPSKGLIIILNKLKSLFKCKISEPVVQKPPVKTNLFYVGTYTYGSSVEKQTPTQSAPPVQEDFDLLVSQIENLFNTNLQPVNTYYISTKTKNEVFNNFFQLTASLLGSHFIAIPASLNINNIFDVTFTNVTNSFDLKQVVINGINYNMYILNQIILNNTVTYYYLA